MLWVSLSSFYDTLKVVLKCYQEFDEPIDANDKLCSERGDSSAF